MISYIHEHKKEGVYMALDTKTFTIRIAPEMHKKLREAAFFKEISVNSIINTLLDRHLDDFLDELDKEKGN